MVFKYDKIDIITKDIKRPLTFRAIIVRILTDFVGFDSNKRSFNLMFRAFPSIFERVSVGSKFFKIQCAKCS